jgi:hypothetical protein
MEVAALIVSILALLLATVVGVAQLRLQARTASIEQSRRTDEIEARKSANVTVRLEALGRLDGLVIRADGPATARSVGVDVPAEAMIHGETTTFDAILPGQQVTIRVSPLFRERSIAIRLHWTDDAGQHDVPMTLTVDK